VELSEKQSSKGETLFTEANRSYPIDQEQVDTTGGSSGSADTSFRKNIRAKKK